MERRLALEKAKRGRHSERFQASPVAITVVDELLDDDRPRAGARQSRRDGRHTADQPGDHRQHLDAPEVHVAQHQVLLRRPERGDHERQREREQQRLRLRLAVERRDRARERDADDGEDDTGGQCDPEGGVAVDRAEVLALDQRRAERKVGEDHHEAGEHERERGESVLVRGEQARDEDRHHGTGDLGADLGGRDPDESLQDAGAQVRDPWEQTVRHRCRC